MRQMNFCPMCGAHLQTAQIGGADRLMCSNESCPYIFWDNPVPVVAALVEYHGDYILARNKAWPEGMFGLISGFLEKGETPEAAVVREVKEELGLDASGQDFIGVYAFEQQNQLIIAYHVVCSLGNITVGEELAEIKLVAPDKLEAWSFGTGLAVRDWLNRSRVSRF